MLGLKITKKQSPIIQQRGNFSRNFRSNELYKLLSAVL